MLPSLPSTCRVFLMLTALGAANAGAVIFAPKPFIESTDLLVGDSGRVNVLEALVVEPPPIYSIESSEGEIGNTWIGYFVDVIDPTATVSAFAISLADLSTPFSTLPGWGAQLITPRDWDAKGGMELPGGGDTSSLGSYYNFFEEGAPAVAYFYLDPLQSGAPITEANDQDPGVQGDPSAIGFRVDGSILASSMIVLGPSGSIVDGGSSIPEPTAASLLGVLGLMLLVRRRR